MNETNLTAKRSYSGIGIIYSILSVAITLLQLAVSFLGLKVLPAEIYTMNVQILLNSVIFYIGGWLILYYGFRRLKLQSATLAKHNMSVTDMIKAFCMCYTLLIGSNLIGMGINTLIGNIIGKPIVNPVEEMVFGLSMPVLFFATVICAPIFEELFFRKFLIDRVVTFGEVPAVLLSGFMFGLFHGNLSQLPYAFAIGVFFGFIYVRTGRIIYTIILHAIVNFFGSIASTLVLNSIGTDMLDILANAGSDTEFLASLNTVDLSGFIILLIYEIFIIILVIIGLILWILEFKKFAFFTRENDMLPGSRFRTVMHNPGMIIYIVAWLIMIVYNMY